MKLPQLSLRDLFWLVLVIGVTFSFWQAYVVLKRRAMLKVLTDAGCYWKQAEMRDIADRPQTIIPMIRSPFGDTPVACIFVDRSPLESRHREINWMFPEAMMPIE